MVAVIGQGGVAAISLKLQKVVLARAGADMEVHDGVEPRVLLIDEDVVAGAPEQPVLAALAVQRLTAAMPPDPVGEVVTGPGDVPGHQPQILDIVGQSV